MNYDSHDQTYLKTLTILYVEDEELTLEMTSQFLSRISKVLVTAKNGAEGLEAFRKNRPDIIVTDIQMPVMDGLSMAAEIRAINETVPIIVLTAFCDSSYLMKAINMGLNKYISKPVDGAQLHEALVECAHRLMIEEKLKQVQAELKVASSD